MLIKIDSVFMKVCIYLIDDECVKDDLNVGKVVIIMGF